ncbi:MAG: murein biosynthesis integral membrane protein MurJ [Candidatus Abyssubacteria bacterium]
MPEQPPTRQSIARSSAVISSGTMTSRVLGLGRDMVIAHLYPRFVSDAFFVAFRLPNMLREMLAEGAMNAGFIPVFSDYMMTRSRKETEELVAAALGAAAAVLMCVSALGVILAPWLVRFITLEFGPADGNLLLAIDLARFLFPYILLVGIASLLMAILNAVHRFFSSAYAPMLLNLSMIVCAYLFRNAFREPVFALAVGVLAGGVLQILLQIPFLRGIGVRMRVAWNLRHEGIRRIFKLLVPTFFGQAVREINVIVDTMLAWYLGVGMVSALYYSFRLVHLPLAVFGLAVATATLPAMSRCAAARDFDGLKQRLTQGLSAIFFMMFPATVGLMVLREPIVRLLFEHGAFDAATTRDTAFALLFYSVGLFAFAGSRIMAFAFYSLQETRTPVISATIAMVANIGLNLLLMIPLRQGGLALASSLSSTLNMVTLWIVLNKRIGDPGGRAVMGAAVRMLVLSAAMGVLVYALLKLCGLVVDTETLSGQIMHVAVPMLGGAAFYLIAAFILRFEEASQLRVIWTRRSRGQ